MILLINYCEDNTTEFVIEVEAQCKIELIKTIKKFENKFYELREQDDEDVRGVFITNYIYDCLDDDELQKKLKYGFCEWDLYNVD